MFFGRLHSGEKAPSNQIWNPIAISQVCLQWVLKTAMMALEKRDEGASSVVDFRVGGIREGPSATFTHAEQC
jgi:hypothetical protein